MRTFAIAALILATPLAAQEPPALYPPGVAERAEYVNYMSRTVSFFASQPLWTEEAMDGYVRRYRATFDGGSLIQADLVQVAIDEREDGSALVSGTVRTTKGNLVEEVQRELSSEDYAAFRLGVDESGLWSSLPESWRRAPNTFCAHGRHVVLEKHDGDGYGLSDAEHCTAPAYMVMVLDTMLDLAQFESRSSWRPRMWWDR